MLDLAGTIVGVAASRSKIIDGSRISTGDVVLGLPSNGLHTNGYSLARGRCWLETMKFKPSSKVAGITLSIGEELLRVHRNYQPLLAKLPHGIVKGLAHITGGGLIDNLPRVLPKSCDAVINTRKWKVPKIFRLIQEGGKVPAEEMYQVFNMGIGMAIVTSAANAGEVIKRTRARRIGTIEPGEGKDQAFLLSHA